MPTLQNYSLIEIRDLRSRIQSALENCASLQEAAQVCVRLLYEEFQESIVLARVFVTLPFKELPERDGAFVRDLAEAKGVLAQLGEKTPVLSLVGTHGARPEWNDRHLSQGHLGIPLVTANFVESIPMVSRLMRDMGFDLTWFDEREPDIVVKRLGQIAGVFYVRDARTRLDRQERKIVSAQDFVVSHHVKTVFGLGGSYLNGSFVTIIIFTRVTLDREQAESFMLLVNTFKAATMSMVMQNKIFV